MSRITAATFFLLAAPFAACTFKTVTPIDPEPEVVATEEFEQVENTAINILLVVDNSGSMAEEQQNLKANVAKFIDVIEATGAEAQIAAVVTDLINNPDGTFFKNPTDVTLSNGTMVLEIPNNSGPNNANPSGNDNNSFCNDVINASATTQRGILNPADPALLNVISNAGLIPDFMGRAIGSFQDGNNDKIADNTVTASFADAVGCILSSGIRGNGQECALGAIGAALDEDSLANENFGFDPRTNDALLAIITLGDEDAGEAPGVTIAGGEFQVQPLNIGGSPIGGLLSASNELDICDSGINGQLDNLEPVETFANEVKRIRPDNKIFVATIAGPPGAVVAECDDTPFPVPACSNAFSGSASPGNRIFQFAQLFTNKFDALDFNICDPQFGDGIADIANEIGALLNGGCLNNPIAAGFDPATDIRVLFDLSQTGNTDCGSIGNNVAVQVAPNVCQINATSLDIQNVGTAVCAGGFQVGFLGFTPPTGARVTIEYLADPLQ